MNINTITEIEELCNLLISICMPDIFKRQYSVIDKYINLEITKEELSKNNNQYCNDLLKNNKLKKDIFDIPDNVINLAKELSKLYDDKLNHWLVNWLMYYVNDKDKRISIFKSLCKRMSSKSDIYDLYNDTRGLYVIFSDNVEIHTIKKLADIVQVFNSSNTNSLYYRGHENSEYRLLPSIYRSDILLENENYIFNEMLAECNGEFVDCKTQFSKLVKMQHLGIPTRLLDITTNPLVALYFSCLERDKETCGEIIVISSSKRQYSFEQNKAVVIKSYLSSFSKSEKDEISTILNGNNDYYLPLASQNKINDIFSRASCKISDIVSKEEIESVVITYPPKNNPRILNQHGLFLLVGLEKSRESCQEHLESLRYRKDGKLEVYLVPAKCKKLINGELEACEINNSTMFPESPNIALHIKDKYSGKFD